MVNNHPKLFFFFLLLLFSHSLSKILGVHKDEESKYSGSTFKCDDKTIPIRYINDDYCDCEDGTDEPGTAACPNGHFYCQNKGYISKTIVSSRVNDGICDCCDGSDEYLTKICSNKCIDFGATNIINLKAQLANITSALKLKKEYIEKASQNKFLKNKALRELVVEIENKEKEVQEFKKLNEEADEMLYNYKEQKEALKEEETIHQEEIKNQDESINIEDIDANPNIETKEDEDNIVKDSEELLLEEKVELTKSVYNEANKELKDLKDKEKEFQKFFSTDFGPKDVLSILYDECFETISGKYTYEVCPFKQAYQKDTGSKTNLGMWKNWEVNSEFHTMLFEDGQTCWNGPKRSLKITFECRDHNELTELNEPSICVYEAKFLTPLVCTEELLQEIQTLYDQANSILTETQEESENREEL